MKELNQFNQTHVSPKKQASRLLNAIGLNIDNNPAFKKRGARTSHSHDPNIVLFDIECGGDKSGGARDILELRVNSS